MTTKPTALEAGEQIHQALYLQQYGRALRGRLVHAQRARKLRRRGESVRFSHNSPSGRAVYRWFKQARIIDHVVDHLAAMKPRITPDLARRILAARAERAQKA